MNGYDHTQAGVHFVTVVTQGRVPLFGNIVDSEMQRNYYDHISRNQDGFELTWQYIDSNPARWAKDEEDRPK